MISETWVSLLNDHSCLLARSEKKDVLNLRLVCREIGKKAWQYIAENYRFQAFDAKGQRTYRAKHLCWNSEKSADELAEEKIITLVFCAQFNQPVNQLPTSLTHITFGWNFNQSVDDLPISLTHLTFGLWFNRSVDQLPANLTQVTFGYWFNQPVNHLPKSLTHLTFGWAFNQLVDELPEGLTHLTFGSWFNQPIDHLSLAQLQYLNIPKSYPHSLESFEKNGKKIIRF